MERVAVLIGRCAIYEQLYLTGDIPPNAQEATENLRRVLLTIYMAILQVLCRMIRVFEGRALYLSSKWYSWVIARLILYTRKTY